MMEQSNGDDDVIVMKVTITYDNDDNTENCSTNQKKRVQFQDVVDDDSPEGGVDQQITAFLTIQEVEATWWSFDELRDIMNECYKEVERYQSHLQSKKGTSSVTDIQQRRNVQLFTYKYRGLENIVSNRPYKRQRREATRALLMRMRKEGNNFTTTAPTTPTSTEEYARMVTESTKKAIYIANIDEKIVKEFSQNPARSRPLVTRKVFTSRHRRHQGGWKKEQQAKPSQQGKRSTWSSFFNPSSWVMKQ